MIRPSPALMVPVTQVRRGDRYVDGSGAAWVVLEPPAREVQTGQPGMVTLRVGHTEYDPGMPLHFGRDDMVPVLRHRWMRAPGPGGGWVTTDPTEPPRTHEGPPSA